jgi:acyl-CoA thioester hydrolase
LSISQFSGESKTLMVTCINISNNIRNNVIYARYAETSRLAYITQILGVLPWEQVQQYLSADPIGPIVKSLTINYKSPVKFPDTILVASTVPTDKLTSSSFTHEFIMISHDQERIVATGHAVIVMYNFKQFCKADLPESFVSAMSEAFVPEIHAKI